MKNNPLKVAAKVVGTATLVTTGTASTVLKGISDVASLELGSEFFEFTKNASFNGIRSLWSNGNDTREQLLDKVDNITEKTSSSIESGMQRAAADTAKRMADIQKKNNL